MSFSPFDPSVMRRVLGRAAPRPDPRGPVGGPAERLERGADFETARLNDAYREMERALRELIAHPFIREDAETLGRIESLLYCVDMEDFAHRFDLVARHIEARLEVLAAAGGVGTRLRPAAGGPVRVSGTPSPSGHVPARQQESPPAPPARSSEREARPTPASPGQRMRLNL